MRNTASVDCGKPLINCLQRVKPLIMRWFCSWGYESLIRVPWKGQCWALNGTDIKSMFISMDFRIILQHNSNHLLSTWYAFHTLPLILTTAAFHGFHYFFSSSDEGIEVHKGCKPHPRWHRWKVTELRLELRSFWPHSLCLFSFSKTGRRELHVLVLFPSVMYLRARGRTSQIRLPPWSHSQESDLKVKPCSHLCNEWPWGQSDLILKRNSHVLPVSWVWPW